MSARRSVPIAWRDALRDSELPSVAKLVGHTLSTFFDAEGRAFPGKERLAKGASLTDRSVDKGVDVLETAGFLRVARTKGGNNRTNRYFALLPEQGTAFPVEMAQRRTAEPSMGKRPPSSGERDAHESAESAKRDGRPQKGPAIAEDASTPRDGGDARKPDAEIGTAAWKHLAALDGVAADGGRRGICPECERVGFVIPFAQLYLCSTCIRRRHGAARKAAA